MALAVVMFAGLFW